MSLEYLKNEKNEEYINLKEKRTLTTTIGTLIELQKSIILFKYANHSKSGAIRWIDRLAGRLRHPEFVEDEIVLFNRMIEDWVNKDVPIDYKRILEVINTRFNSLREMSSKKVAITPEEAMEAERLAKIYMEDYK